MRHVEPLDVYHHNIARQYAQSWVQLPNSEYLHVCCHAAGSQHVPSGYLDEELLDELDDDDEQDEDELHHAKKTFKQSSFMHW